MVWQWLGFLGGVLLILTTIGSIIGSIIVPRSTTSVITYRSWQMVHGAYSMVARRFPAYDQQDRILVTLGPVAILFNLGVWVIFFLVGYALMFLPFVQGDVGMAIRLSGSSIFTLGVASSAQPGPIVLEFMAAATGLVVIALLIGYLPTIYGAYNRRETLVTALSSRAGDPAWGPEILIRHQLDGSLPTLGVLYTAWEALAADIAESHSSYPWLVVFRSPDALHSWVTSLLAMLDSAALFLALAPTQAPMGAGQCLRMGFLCMRKIAKITGTPVEDDPRPDDPIALTYAQFAHAVTLLRQAGFPLEKTAEEAWVDFKGWRVNYEAAAYVLAEFVVAVPAPWSGHRHNMTTSVIDVLSRRPRHRTPEDPEGDQVRRLSDGSDAAVPQMTLPGTPH